MTYERSREDCWPPPKVWAKVLLEAAGGSQEEAEAAAEEVAGRGYQHRDTMCSIEHTYLSVLEAATGEARSRSSTGRLLSKHTRDEGRVKLRRAGRTGRMGNGVVVIVVVVVVVVVAVVVVVG